MDMKVFKRSRLIHLLFAISYFTSGLIINTMQCILYYTVHKINKTLYRKLNYYLCCSLYSQLVFMGDWWSNSKIILYIDKNDFDQYWGKEHACCIMNHTYEIDWLIGWMTCDRINMLGNCKAYAKKVIQYLPVLGWCWKFSEFVFLERSYEKDRANIHKQVGELADHPDPMWLLLFPEGTRFSQSKHKASEQFATERNYKQLKYHLQPRTRGFVTSLPPMHGKVPAVYDIIVAFDENDSVKPTITSMLHGKAVTAHMYMKRIPLEEVPESEADQDNFIRELFQKKDQMKESFVKTGDFFETSGVERVEGFSLPRRLHPLINMVMWMITILCPMIYYLIRLLFSGQMIYFCIGAGILLIFYCLLNRSIGMSKISKQSSYGGTAQNATTIKKDN
ncbi:PREDICTED: 1-acyl-sn-glycerol-3-phosphate acyltransferase gamma [Nicrophorus vespilloides]|uniref:1-acyl-sn-glycerol-3-phosphate acyltransferase gamma n=1 Tax=Nicrophorus vespilloides TaxID=110193 RepID=A0ABM1MQZ5_NICVS|nr:PREDICTED: 1-acyl-sn-glycerol-3-phosphate acyltransferase gamma [Nicrophorus vespilloides]